MENFQELLNKISKLEGLLLEQKTVLNFEQVADYTGLSKSYLYKLTCSGGIPCYKPQGKHIYFSKPEIDSWLLQNRKSTTQEIQDKASTIVTLEKKVR